MKCYDCGKPIEEESRRMMEEVRMFRWSSTLVPFHKECWEKRRTSEAKKRYAKMFLESLVLIATAISAMYIIV